METELEKETEKESRPIKAMWMRFPHIVIFLFFWLVINNPMVILNSFLTSGLYHQNRTLLLIGLLIVPQGIVYSIYFSASKLQKILYPIIWVLIFVTSGFLTIIIVVSITDSFVVFEFWWGILGITLWGLFFRKTNLGLLPALYNLVGVVALGLLVDIANFEIIGGIVYAIISAIPFIYVLLSERKKTGINRKLKI